MGLVLQVLMIVTLLFCDSHQLGRKGDGPTSFLGHRSAGPRPGKYQGNGYNSGMGPYDIDVKLFRQCDDRGVNLVDLTLEAYNTKTANGSKILYRGNFTTPFTPEQFEKLTTIVEVFRQKDKKEFLMLKYNETVCEALMGPAKDVYTEVKKEFDVKNVRDDQCLVPKGFYSFNDWDVKGELPPPIMEYGDYRGVVRMFHEQQMFICLEVFVEVKQKM